MRKHTRPSLLLVLVLALALFAAACGDDDSADTSDGGDGAAEPADGGGGAAEGEPITIGASLPLTGRFSAPGTAANNGYETWKEMVNESGGLLGRPVELVIVDNASEQDDAVADYERLITQDEVDLVVGPFSSFLVIPTSVVADKYGYAFVEPAGGSPDVFNRGLTNVFFAQPARGSFQADPFAEYVLGLPDDARPQTFSASTIDDPFTAPVIERMIELLTAGGLEQLGDLVIYPEDQTDFSSIATQIADLDADLHVGGTIIEDSIGLIRAFQVAGYQPDGAFFTTGPSIPGAFKEGVGDATEGVFAAMSWYPDADEFQNADFVAKYTELFGGDITDIEEDAANAFTVGQVLGQAIENIQSIDNAALIEELHQGTYETVVGPLSFDEVGAPQGDFMLLQWQGDQFYIVVNPREGGDVQADPIWPKPPW